MQQKSAKKEGCARLVAAFSHSRDGLHAAFFREAAFRQELVVLAVAGVGLWLLPLSAFWKALLFVSSAGVLAIELLNSAIEAVVDLIAPEYHELAKLAKDLGSAAVFVALAATAVLWIWALSSLIVGG